MDNTQGKNIDFSTVELKEYFDIFLKRKWIILICFLFVFSVVSGYTFSKKPIYRATARIEIGSGFRMPLKEVYDENRRMFVKTQMELIKSDKLKQRVIKKISGEEDSIPEEYLEPEITVTQVRGTTMLEIWVDSPYKGYTKEYLENLISEFLITKKEQKEKSSEFAIISLTKEANELGEKLTAAQNDLQKYREENEEITIEEFGNFSHTRLSNLTMKLSEIETNKSLIEKQITTLEGSNEPSLWVTIIDNIQQGVVMPAVQKETQPLQGDQSYQQDDDNKDDDNNQNISNVQPLPFVFVLEKGQSNAWEQLKKRYASTKSELAGIQNVYKPEHPKRKALELELKNITLEMKAEVASLLETFKARQKSLQLEEDVIKNNIQKWQDSNLVSSSKINQLKILKDKVFRLQKLYDVLLKRVNEIQVSTDFGLENVYIVEDPKILDLPVAPKKAKYMILGLLFGIGLGCGVAFFLEYIDDSIKSTDDIKKYIGIPTLGLVNRAEWSQGNLPSHKITIFEGHGLLESYRAIRTNILLSKMAPDINTLLITSAVPSEGKTTTAANTAIVLAQGGIKVLLIDGDLRKPTLHKMFKVKNLKGFSSILAGVTSVEECIKKTKIENLDLLPAGEIVHDPQRLFHTIETQKFIKKLESKYDKIIIDSAPVMTVKDSVVLGNLVDAIILVVQGGRTSRVMLAKAKEAFLENSSKILGCIINNLPAALAKRSDNYYGYKYGYIKGKKQIKKKTKETNNLIA